jgi:hypothetical protein
MDGTSMATPYAAATVALARAANRHLTAAQAVRVVEQTATDLGATGRDSTFGFGLVNPVGAVRAAVATASAHALTVTASASTVTYGRAYTVTVTAADGGGHRVSGLPVTLTGTSVDGRSRSATTVTTGSDGRVRASATARGATRWVATAGALTSKAVTVGVTAPVAARSTARGALTATVSGPAGRTVTVQRRTGGHWVSVRTVRHAAARVTFSRLSPGTYRAAVPATATLRSTASGATRVR